MSETLLVLNAGSSSIKFQVFDLGPDDVLTWQMKGQIEGVGTAPRLIVKGREGGILI